MPGFDESYRAFDGFQQRHRSLGFPLAVLKKFAPAGLLDKGIRKANKLSTKPRPVRADSPQVPQKV